MAPRREAVAATVVCSNRRPESASALHAKGSEATAMLPAPLSPHSQTTDLQRRKGGPLPCIPELLAFAAPAAAAAAAAVVVVVAAAVVEQLPAVANVVQNASSLRRGDSPWLRTTTNKG